MKNFFPNIKLFLGIVVFIILIIIPAPESINPAAWKTMTVALLMAYYWITESIPISTTALIPLVLFPLLGITTMKAAAAPYAHELIFLFLGGFILAQAIQKWGLHERIALTIIRLIGYNPKSIILGFMISSAFLSMWISNTATALMMLPIALSVLKVMESGNETENIKLFGTSLMLAIAYSCSMGGIGTLIGTPPNAIAAAFVKDNYNIDIGFTDWLMVGLPFVFIGLPIIYFILTRVVFKLSDSLMIDESFFAEKLSNMKKMSNEEKKVLFVFASVAVLWIIRPVLNSYVPNISDSSIAIAGAITLFFIPASKNAGQKLLNWNDVEKISWGILILFGGGLSLANAITVSGLSEWLGNLFSGLYGINEWIIIFLLTTLVIFLTELTSNAATTAAFIPIVASIAVGMEVDVLTFVVPTTIAASCAFMLPVATPPNAIVFSSGRITISQMSRAGFRLNIIFAFIISTIAYIVLKIM